jgi:hypothetical protein
MLGTCMDSDEVAKDSDEEAKSQRISKAARFPAELLLIAFLYAIAYARDLAGCSSRSGAPQASARGSTRPTSAAR